MKWNWHGAPSPLPPNRTGRRAEQQYVGRLGNRREGQYQAGSVLGDARCAGERAGIGELRRAEAGDPPGEGRDGEVLRRREAGRGDVDGELVGNAQPVEAQCPRSVDQVAGRATELEV